MTTRTGPDETHLSAATSGADESYRLDTGTLSENLGDLLTSRVDQLVRGKSIEEMALPILVAPPAARGADDAMTTACQESGDVSRIHETIPLNVTESNFQIPQG